MNIVFIHGFLGTPSSWDEVRGVIDHPSLSIALPGHGPDPWKPPEDTFVSAADALPLDGKAWLVAYSMGARLALTFAIPHPDRVAGAVLIGCDPGLRTERERIERAAADAAAADRLALIGLESFVSEWEARPIFGSQASLPHQVREEHRKRRSSHTTAGIAWALRTLSPGRMPPVWDELAKCRVPLHFVAGEHDRKFCDIARNAVDVAPNARHTIVAGVGHDVVLESPMALATIVREELKTSTQRRGS